jgi:hypothetical protein
MERAPADGGMRMLGWLLLLYAAAGAVLMVAALAIGGPLFGRLDRLTSSAAGTMDAAAEAAVTAADAFTGFDASLVEARRSADEAAGLSRDASGTLQALSDAMGISILGSQPLLPLADEFATSSRQLQQMGDTLEGIGSALTINQDDVARVGVELRTLAGELNLLRGRVASEQSGSRPPLSWLFYGFLAWQTLPIAAAAVGGLMALRRVRPPIGV